MTAPLSAERIKELKLWLKDDVCFRVIRGHESYWTIRDDVYKADLLAILSSHEKMWAENEGLKNNWDYWQQRVEKKEADLEQTRVQLAGCGCAALGATKDPAKQGDFGWSPSYQDVLKLRIKWEKAEAQLARQAPLIQAAMGATPWGGMNPLQLEFYPDDAKNILRAAHALREEKK